MKTMKLHWMVFLVTVAALLTSCASHHVADEGLFQKRKYRKGWHWGGGHNKPETSAKERSTSVTQPLDRRWHALAPTLKISSADTVEVTPTATYPPPIKVRTIPHDPSHQRESSAPAPAAFQPSPNTNEPLARMEEEAPEKDEPSRFKKVMRIIALTLAILSIILSVGSGVLVGAIALASIMTVSTILAGIVLPYTELLIVAACMGVVATIISLFSLPEGFDTMIICLTSIGLVPVSPIIGIATALFLLLFIVILGTLLNLLGIR